MVRSHVFRPVTNLTLTKPLIFHDEGPNKVDYYNITSEWANTGSTPILHAIPEKVPIKVKLTQVYQYVA